MVHIYQKYIPEFHLQNCVFEMLQLNGVHTSEMHIHKPGPIYICLGGTKTCVPYSVPRVKPNM